MNTIKVPFIEGIEKMSYEEMDMAMETGAAKSFIGCVNWQEYPYRPRAYVTRIQEDGSIFDQ